MKKEIVPKMGKNIVQNRRKFLQKSLVTPLIGMSAIGLILAKAAQAQSLNPSQKKIVTNTIDYYNSLRKIRAYFIQRNHQGNIARGTFYMSRPGQARFDYAPPSTLTVISDGSNVLISDITQDVRSVYPLFQTPLRYIVKDQIIVGDDIEVSEVFIDPEIVTIVARENGTVTSGQIELTFDSITSDLLQWVSEDANGERTTVKLSTIRAIKKFPERMFFINYAEFEENDGDSNR